MLITPLLSKGGIFLEGIDVNIKDWHYL